MIISPKSLKPIWKRPHTVMSAEGDVHRICGTHTRHVIDTRNKKLVFSLLYQYDPISRSFTSFGKRQICFFHPFFSREVLLSTQHQLHALPKSCGFFNLRGFCLQKTGFYWYFLSDNRFLLTQNPKPPFTGVIKPSKLRKKYQNPFLHHL